MDYKYKDLFLQDSTKKELHITYDSGEITNAELHSNHFDLTESICSENELRFGGCEASCVRFKISNIFESLVGKEIDVSMVLDNHKDNPFKFGKYKVFSDVPTADRAFKEIVAYDKMYDIINTDVAEWYNSLMFPMTMKQFRTSFVSYFGLIQVDKTLVNDDMTIEKTIETVELSGRDVARAICELNACFGHINRDGKFDYIVLSGVTELYPSNDLYPSNEVFPLGNASATLVKRSHYISCQYEDFKTGWIEAVEVRPEEESAGAIVGDEAGNVYTVYGNFLLYGKSTSELSTIAQNILNATEIIQYRPAKVSAVGNPTICVGDGIRLNTKHEIVNTYVLQRTLSGIQALKDTYMAEGTERYDKNINSAKKDVIKLKSKVNILTRTVDETKSSIDDLDKNLRSEITQSASALRSEISTFSRKTREYTDNKLKSYSTTTEMNSAIEQTASEINLNVSNVKKEVKKYADSVGANSNKATDDKLKSYSTTTEMNSAIKVASNSVKIEVAKTYQTIDDANETTTELRSSITQTSGSVTTEVSRAKDAEDKLSSRITQNADGISLKVSKGNVSSEISQESGRVSIKGNRLEIESDNFKVDTEGKVEIGLFARIDQGIEFRTNYANSPTDPSPSWVKFAYGGTYGIAEGWAPAFYINNSDASYCIISNLKDKTYADGVWNFSDSVNVTKDFYVNGTKSRIASTKNYGERLLYCYETPTPMFGDIGEGQLDDTGKCYIYIDDMFGETIDSDCHYQVFLQQYGKGELYVTERTPSYFIVEGTKNLRFGWEIKAIQKEYDTMRLEMYEEEKIHDVNGEISTYIERLVEESNKNVTSETYNYLTESLYSPESEVI